MNPLFKSQEHRRLKITIETKREIINLREQGISVAEIARKYNRATSTICTILKNKDRLKEVEVSKGVTRLSSRSRILDEVEKLLLIWLNEKQSRGENININTVCEKAKLIFDNLTKDTPSTTGEEDFKGSRGWFQKFKRRIGENMFVKHDEPRSLDLKVEENLKISYFLFISLFQQSVQYQYRIVYCACVNRQ